MICFNCKNHIPDDSIFCPICRDDLRKQPQRSQPAVKCSSCGMANKPEAKFCARCGKDFTKPEQPKKSKKCSKTKKAVISILLIFLLVGTVVGIWYWNNSKEEPQPDVHETLQTEINTYIKDEGVNKSLSIYYKELDSGKKFIKNSHSMRAAASGRIFVLEYIMEAIDEGRMSRSPELMETIKTTVTGDEPSSRKLVQLITGDYDESLELVKAFVESKGYKDTTINRFHGDLGSGSVNTPNETSVKDTAAAMIHIYRASEDGNQFAKELLDIMATDASPKKGLAEGARQANSAIDVSNFEATYTVCENDVALVQYEGRPVVISVMIAGLTDSQVEHPEALENIRTIARMICETLYEENQESD